MAPPPPAQCDGGDEKAAAIVDFIGTIFEVVADSLGAYTEHHTDQTRESYRRQWCRRVRTLSFPSVSRRFPSSKAR